MKQSLLTGLTLIALSNSVSAQSVFEVDSSHEGLDVPYLLCENGRSPNICHRFTADGREIFIISRTKKPVTVDVGIQIQTSTYKVGGCTQIANGYCLFNLSNSMYSRLVLTPVKS